MQNVIVAFAHRIPIKLVGALCVIFLLGFLYIFASHPTLAMYAKRITKICSSESYRPACYDREIPKLMSVLSMEEAFAVTKIIQHQDSSYTYCHVLGHELAAREVAKDPSQWQRVVERVPSGMCSNGGIHGAFQERFRTDALPEAQLEELVPILEGICRPHDTFNPTLLEQATCTHAIGHLAMYVTSADVPKSLALCERVAPREGGHDFRQICFDGVFMQIFQPLEPEDFALVEGKTPTLSTVHSFCSAFSGKEKESCWTESWPLSLTQIKKPTGLVSFCAQLSGEDARTRCYNGMLYVLTAIVFNFNPQKITDYCIQLPLERGGQCFAFASSRLIETDWENIPRSVALCKVADEHGVGDACYMELVRYSTYNFHANSPEFYQLCNALPENWKKTCLAQSS